MFCTIDVLLVAKPPFLFEGYTIPTIQNDEYRGVGIIALLMNALINGISFIILKPLATSINSNLSVFYGGLIPCLLSLADIDRRSQKFHPDSLVLHVKCFNIWLLRTSVSCQIFQVWKTREIGYHRIFSDIFSCVLDLVVLGSSPDFYSLIGGFFILSCMILSLYRTIITVRNADITVNSSIHNSSK